MTIEGGPSITCSACGNTWTLAPRTLVPGDRLSFGYDVEAACPECGAVDRSIRTGDSFSVREDGTLVQLVRALRPEGATLDDYERLAKAVRVALNAGGSTDEVADAVASSRFPALAILIRSARNNPAVAVSILSLIATVVFGILQAAKPAQVPTPPPTVNVTVQYEPPSEDTVRRLVDEELQRREAAERATRDEGH